MGQNFGGLAPLLTMLNSCAAGVAVVNIDNGFGAGYMAHSINLIGEKTHLSYSGNVTMRVAYVQGMHGVSGAMLLGALLDLGASWEGIQEGWRPSFVSRDQRHPKTY